jgi:hypothetical protein
MFLIPALAGGGGIAYYAWNKRKKQRPARYGTVAEKGSPRVNKRIRIDVPPSALPDDFFRSLTNIDDDPRARTRLQAKQAFFQTIRDTDMEQIVASAQDTVKKAAQEAPGKLSLLGSVLGEATGIPSIGRALREGGMALGGLDDIDNWNGNGRYALSSLGNAAFGISGLNMMTLPILGALLKQPRLAAWMKSTPRGSAGLFSRNQLRSFPTLGRILYNRTFRNKMDPTRVPLFTGLGGQMKGPYNQAARRQALGLSSRGAVDRARDIRFRYDPQRFAWQNPTTNSGLFRNFLSAGSVPPNNLPRHLITAGRYGANRVFNAGYRAHQFARRNPNLSLFAVGMPLSGLGTAQDELKARQTDWTTPRFDRGVGPHGMPISAALGGITSLFGAGNPNTGVLDQIRSTVRDPYASIR